MHRKNVFSLPLFVFPWAIGNSSLAQAASRQLPIRQNVAKASAPPITLTKNGRSNYVIALASDAIPSEKTAARTLQNYLEQISSAKLPIKDENQVAATQPQIVVGTGRRAQVLGGTELKKIGRDGIVIKTVGRNLILAGDRPRGSLYAVQEFLEKYAGVRWWAPNESTVPQQRTLQVLAANVSYTPPFFYREQFTDSVQHDPNFATKMRENGHFQIQDATLGGHYSIIGFVHTFGTLLPPEKYFAAHPEWFSDPANGDKPCTAQSKMPTGNNWQLNLTNAAMRAELTKNVLARIRTEPGAGIISVSQNDNVRFCRSAGDLALIEREGTPAAPMIEMINEVATAVKREFPGFLVETLAYQYTRRPPRTLVPRDNVIVRLCSIEADFARPLDSEANHTFRDDMNGWRAIAPRLYVWDYITNFSNSLWPHPNLQVLAPNLRYFARSKVGGVFEQGDAYSNGTGDFTQLRAWLVAHLMWNPARDDNALIDEFLRGYYGEAAPHLRAYLDEIRTAFLKTGGPLSTYQNNNAYLSLDVVGSAWAHFAAAQNAVKNDAILSQRVRRERLVLDHVILERYAQFKVQAASGKYVPAAVAFLPQDISAFNTDFLATARANHVEQFREGVSFDVLESSLNVRYGPPMPAPAVLPNSLQDAWREGRVIEVKPASFRYVLPGISDRVDDVLASNGQAGRLVGNSSEWALQFPLMDHPSLMPNAQWRLYVVARIESKAGAKMEGGAFTAGVYDTKRRVNQLEQTLPLEGVLADGKYHVINVSRTELNDDSYLYIAPPHREDIAYVFIDSAFLVREK